MRLIEPEGVTVSLGGEIGEVGEKNSTLKSQYINGYNKVLAQLGDGLGLA